MPNLVYKLQSKKKKLHIFILLFFITIISTAVILTGKRNDFVINKKAAEPSGFLDVRVTVDTKTNKVLSSYINNINSNQVNEVAIQTTDSPYFLQTDTEGQVNPIKIYDETIISDIYDHKKQEFVKAEMQSTGNKIYEFAIKNTNKKYKFQSHEPGIAETDLNDVKIQSPIFANRDLYSNGRGRKGNDSFDIWILGVKRDDITTDTVEEYQASAEYLSLNLLSNNFWGLNKDKINIHMVNDLQTEQYTDCHLKFKTVTNNKTQVMPSCKYNDKIFTILGSYNPDYIFVFLSTKGLKIDYEAAGTVLNGKLSTIPIGFAKSASHESGHGLAGLLDERLIIADTEKSKDVEDNTALNCKKSCTLFDSKYVYGTCYKGCQNNNYYKVTENSLMNTVDASFDALSMSAMQSKFDDITVKETTAYIKYPEPGSQLDSTNTFVWSKAYNGNSGYQLEFYKRDTKTLLASKLIKNPNINSSKISTDEIKGNVSKNEAVVLRLSSIDSNSKILTSNEATYQYKVDINYAPTQSATLNSPNTGTLITLPINLKWNPSFPSNSKTLVKITSADSNRGQLYSSGELPSGITTLKVTSYNSKPFYTNETIYISIQTIFNSTIMPTRYYKFTTGGTVNCKTGCNDDEMAWCAGDTNRDYKIDTLDLTYMTKNINKSTCKLCKGNPAGNDNIINMQDLTWAGSKSGITPPFHTDTSCP